MSASAKKKASAKVTALEAWRARGFDVSVIPIAPHDAEGIPESKRGKIPAVVAKGAWRPLIGWTTKDVPADVLRACGEAGANVGVRTRSFPCADIDVHDPADAGIADAIEAVLAEKLGTAPVRFRGNSPSRAVLYRLAGEPFKKITLRFTTPSGDTDAKLELLGDGQQIVVAGTHTSGATLEWRGGEPVAAELPEVDRDRATAALEAVRAKLTVIGCTGFKVEGVARDAPPRRATSDEVEEVDEPLYFDPWRIKLALTVMDRDDYGAWLCVGMALHAANPDTNGPGLALWDEWSRGSKKYRTGACAAKWRGFNRDGGMTLSALLDRAKRAGWKPPTPEEARESILVRLKDMDEAGCREHWARLVAANGLPDVHANAVEEYVRRRLGISDEEIKTDRDDAAVAADLGLNTARVTLGAALEELNGRHFILRTGGDVGVGMIETNPETDKKILTYQSEQDFLRWYRTTRVETERGAVPTGNAWLNWRGRRQHRGVVLEPDPTKVPEGFLNLWQGFAVEPAPGDWSILRDHISKVICAGTDELVAFVLGWLARSVQCPGDPGEVALVLRGREGTGKGAFLRPWVSLFGAHGLHVMRAKSLTGHFNKHLAFTMALFADEALFAGDRAHEGVLKALITEPTLMVEPKGVDPFEMRNRLKIAMATNNDWAVPAGLDARRFCVLDVSDDKIGNWDYFARLDAAGKDRAVLGAMLHDLLAYDLSKFNVRRIPKTQALEDQKNLTLRGVEAFLRDILLAGHLKLDGDARLPLKKWMATQDLYEAYVRWTRSRRHEGDPIPENSFCRKLVGVGYAQKKEPMAHLRERETKLSPDPKTRLNGYELGSLSVARERFEAATGLTLRERSS